MRPDNEQLWRECPLYRAYEKARKDLRRDFQERIWLKEEERKLLEAIRTALEKEQEPKESYWSRRLFGIFRKRFRDQRSSGWIGILAGFSDAQALGGCRENKTQRYCVALRDAAREMTETG